jgi:hypothetical protein
MHPSRRHGTLILVIAVLALTAGAITVGVFGLIHGPNQSNPAATAPSTAPKPEVPKTPESKAVPSKPVRLPKTDNPVVYARGVAKAIFTWDTMSGLNPADYTNAVVANADPSGLETSGLVDDLAAFLPTDEVWQELRRYQTRQSLTIDSARVPDDWPRVRAEAGHQLRPGTTAVTVTGTRHRAGVWEGQKQTANTNVSFTIFMICKPTYPACHILRLSQPGNPLK